MKQRETISTIFAVRGTLVVGIPTKDGLFIGADKTTNDPVRGVLDEKTKIIQLEPKVAIASTGTPQFYMTRTDHTSGEESTWKAFDVDDVVIGYCQGTKFENTLEFIQGLSQRIREEFKRFLSKLSYENRPPSSNGDDNALFQVAFFFIDDNGMMGITYLICRYKKAEPPFIEFRRHRYKIEDIKNIVPFVAGSTTVCFEIEDGTDERFDDIRNDQSMIRLLKEKPDVESVSIEEAETYCRKLIKVTSERTLLLESSDHHVGLTYDCAIIRPETGFEWLAQDKSVDEQDN